MKLSELITRCKIQVPNLKETGLTDGELTTLLNQAVDEVNLRTKVYRSYTDFDIVAEQATYNLSSVAPTFLGMDKKGVFIKDADDNWKEVYPTTSQYIKSIAPDYLNRASVDIPLWFWVEGDELGFFPKPSTADTDGGRIYHLLKSTPMGNNDHYPFSGSATEITAFRALDDAIIAYVRWKLAPAFGQVSDLDLREREFLAECQRGAKQVKRRPDLYTGFNVMRFR